MIFRKYLNPLGHEDKGSIAVEESPYGLTLSIRDCSRTVSLNFSINSSEDLQNRYDKIKIIRQALLSLEKELKKIENKGEN